MEFTKVLSQVLNEEADALRDAADLLIPEDIHKLMEIFSYLHTVGGELVFCGVGKSRIVGEKLAATFSSLGLPSYVLHPVEALHGDMGKFRKNSGLVLISKSGTTQEILDLLPYLKADSKLTIGLLGAPKAKLAEHCGVVLDCSVKKEACINNLAPTTSSTLAMAMGDAMAVAYEKMVGLSKEGFASNHPAGLLGKALRLEVKDIMTPLIECPIVTADATLKDVIFQMTEKTVGLCAVVEGDNCLQGIMVEGDIRRSLSKEGIGLDSSVVELMTKDPVKISPSDLAMTALNLMENRKNQITQVPVVEEGRFVGALRIHDLLKAGFLKS